MRAVILAAMRWRAPLSLVLCAVRLCSAQNTNTTATTSDQSGQQPNQTTIREGTRVLPSVAGASSELDEVCHFALSTAVHIENKVSQGLLVHKVAPVYPIKARERGIEGTVVLCATIGKDGQIMDLRAASGPEELVPPALKAVKKWRYKPFLLNNEPVMVKTDIRVNFVLSR